MDNTKENFRLLIQGFLPVLQRSIKTTIFIT